MSDRMAAMSSADEHDVVGNTRMCNSDWNQLCTDLVIGPSPLVLVLSRTCSTNLASRPTQ